MASFLKFFIQKILLKLSESSSIFHNWSKKFYDWVYYLFCQYITRTEKNINSIIPSGSYKTNDYTPWKSDIDITIIVRPLDEINFSLLQKRLYRKTRLFSSIFQVIKHIHIIPQNMYSSDLFSLVPPFFSPRDGAKIYKIHSIVCTEEYFGRIYFFLVNKNPKYLSSAKNFLRRKTKFITPESTALLQSLGKIQTDLEIVRKEGEKEIFEKILVTLRRNFNPNAFFITYHHSYLTTNIWTMFQFSGKTTSKTKFIKSINRPPFIKNFLYFVPYKYLPYLKNIVHTKFICYLYNFQSQLLNYISVNNQVIPSLLDEIFIICNYTRTLVEPLDFPYGVNFDRRFNNTTSYKLEHYRGILFALLNFESYLKDKKYHLTPYSIVLENEYIKYKKFLDKKTDLKDLIDVIYKKKYDLLKKVESFLKSSSYQKIIDQINNL